MSSCFMFRIIDDVRKTFHPAPRLRMLAKNTNCIQKTYCTINVPGHFGYGVVGPRKKPSSRGYLGNWNSVKVLECVSEGLGRYG
jgi:hypothetical protein